MPQSFGTRVDVIVRDGSNWWYYEIKTSHSPRACMREAVGQLLEYSFWPGCQALPDWSSSVKPRWTTMGRSTSLGPNNSSLVDRDPLTNITDTRNIVGVWKDGARIDC